MNITLSSFFIFQNRFVVIGWLALVLLPFWQYTPTLVMAIVLLISTAYAYLILFGQRFDQGERRPHYKDFASLSGVVKMFTNRRVTLAGWLHYLAFDLLVGLLIVMDSQQHNISHFLILPVLFLTLMIGPTGLVAYFIVRALYTDNLFDLSWGF